MYLCSHLDSFLLRLLVCIKLISLYHKTLTTFAIVRFVSELSSIDVLMTLYEQNRTFITYKDGYMVMKM